MAEGVALNWDVWETFTSDDWVLEVVQVYRLELWQQPYQRASAVTRQGSQEEWRLIDSRAPLEDSSGGGFIITRTVCESPVPDPQEGWLAPPSI